MAVLEKVRIDKWLWAVRIFKTRSLSSEACKAGRVKIEGQSVKASRLLKVGETVRIQKGAERKVLKVLALLEKRVGAPIAEKCYEDLSPPPMPKQEKLHSVFFNTPDEQRAKGSGRPTKRDRRNLDKFKKRK